MPKCIERGCVFLSAGEALCAMHTNVQANPVIYGMKSPILSGVGAPTPYAAAFEIAPPPPKSGRARMHNPVRKLRYKAQHAIIAGFGKPRKG